MDLRVTRARPVFGDGRHNAFTGIAALDGRPVVAFRSAEDHLSNDGVVTVIARDAEGDWSVADRIHSPRPDYELRGPAVTAFDGELQVHTIAADLSVGPPTRTVPAVATSDDGRSFSDPEPVEGIPEGHRIYDIAEHDGTLYATGYTVKEDATPVLYASETGHTWEKVAAFPETGNEVAIDFGTDGRLWALIRDALGPCPVVCTAVPPYDSFEETREKNVTGKIVPKRLQGALVKRLSGGLVVVGREYDLYGGGKHNTTTNVWWRPDDGDPVLVRSLPSGGDTSYADWLDVAPGRALLSYYSGHAYRMDLPHDEDHLFEESRAYAEQNSPADVYIAEISYPVDRTLGE